MRTAIYIDGYNMYYGVLKHSPYKWLNVYSLFSSLAKENDPRAEIVHCGFYTSLTSLQVGIELLFHVARQRAAFHRAQ